MMVEELKSQALNLWEQGIERQMARDLDAAEALYRQSIALFPTAEAHTFLGWVLSWRGDIDTAIAECHRAIAVDPDFGNPYNDIGAYLIEQEQLDEAIPWFEKAKAASRYEPRHFPYLNLARIYRVQGKVTLAIAELEEALLLDPGNAQAEQALTALRSLN